MSKTSPVPEEIRANAPGYRRWRTSLPYFIGAVLFHLILFLMVASWVIFEAPHPPSDTAVFQSVKVPPPPPPPPPPPSPSQAKGGEARNALEPDVNVAPPVSTPSVVVSQSATAFNVTTANMPAPSLTSLTPPSGTGLTDTGASGGGVGTGTLFGSDNNNGHEMAGFFYDLKQTPDRQPTNMDLQGEIALLKKFFTHGWNEDEWATKFFKSPKPLYANEFLIPVTSSAAGPKSFGLDKICKPGYWAVVYHVIITPTRTGDFRMAGFGDDFLVVRIEGQIVLDAGCYPYPKITDFKRDPSMVYPSDPWLPSHTPHYGDLTAGPSFHVTAGQSMRIDVFLGDTGGGTFGQCSYFLFLMDATKEYKKDDTGFILLPLFQLQPQAEIHRKGKFPPFTSNEEDALLYAPKGSP